MCCLEKWQNSNIHGYIGLFRNFNIRIKQSTNVWVLVWLCKSKIMLYVFRIFYMDYKLYYMDFFSFTVYIKIDNIYKGITEDVDTRFDTSNYELDKPLPKGKYKT